LWVEQGERERGKKKDSELENTYEEWGRKGVGGDNVVAS
jgi:hypothetical protein